MFISSLVKIPMAGSPGPKIQILLARGALGLSGLWEQDPTIFSRRYPGLVVECGRSELEGVLESVTFGA